MKTLYLIPARGGSKGIPHKNIRPLCGLPLIGYSINVAREFADDRDICLSTDDPEIAETARKMGLDVPFMRPDSLATDKSGSYEVMLHALDFLPQPRRGLRQTRASAANIADAHRRRRAPRP